MLPTAARTAGRGHTHVFYLDPSPWNVCFAYKLKGQVAPIETSGRFLTGNPKLENKSIGAILHNG